MSSTRNEREARRRAAARLTIKKALIVDDDAGVANMIALLLGRRDFAVSKASNGEEAILLLTNSRTQGEQSEFDLVLLDLVMPRLSGFRVLEFIERSMPEMTKHVVVVSAEDESKLREIQKRGACGMFLRKPFDVEAFYQNVSACIREHDDEIA